VTDVEKRVRRLGPLKLGIVALAVVALVVPVVAVMAASPDPSTTTPASSAAATPKASASGDVKRDDAAKPDKNDKNDGGRGSLKGLGGFGVGRGGVTITAIDGTKVSLKTADGWTRTITVTAETTITKGGQAIKIGGLDVGDAIAFRQKRNDDGTYRIVAIVVPTPKAAGEVTAVTASSLTIKGRGDKTRTITLNGSTAYQLGKAKGAKSDVKVGSRVVVEGTVSGETFTALTVHVALSTASGEVTAKTSDSITLKRRDGKTTVIHLSSKTQITVRGKAAATVADIAVGDRAEVAGTTRADGSLDALRVHGRAARTNDSKKAPAASTTPG
jgi:uncharacterized protein DUF5666